MSDAAKLFLRRRYYLEAAYFWGAPATPSLLDMEWRVRADAAYLIGWMA